MVYNWRSVTNADGYALLNLEARCNEVDGENAVPQPRFSDLVGQDQTELICMEDPNRPSVLAAVGGIQQRGKTAETLFVRGKVDPHFRRRGLGSHILTWAEERARTMGTVRELVIRNEALTASADGLYRKSGYQRDFVENWMRRDLTAALPQINTSFRHVAWTDNNAEQFFRMYQESFRERPGFPDSEASEWISDTKDDDDFRPDLSFLAYDPSSDQPVGFITSGVVTFHGDPVGWINQVGSIPAYRGRGVAAGLIVAVLSACRAEQLPAVDLHVNDNNPHAKQVYEKLGFRVMGQRAKYSKILPLM